MYVGLVGGNNYMYKIHDVLMYIYIIIGTPQSSSFTVVTPTESPTSSSLELFITAINPSPTKTINSSTIISSSIFIADTTHSLIINAASTPTFSTITIDKATPITSYMCILIITDPSINPSLSPLGISTDDNSGAVILAQISNYTVYILMSIVCLFLWH